MYYGSTEVFHIWNLFLNSRISQGNIYVYTFNYYCMLMIISFISLSNILWLKNLTPDGNEP